jgi:hypothetical protein
MKDGKEGACIKRARDEKRDGILDGKREVHLRGLSTDERIIL